MKKISVATLFFILAIFSHVVSGQERFTGHVWKDMPNEMKMPLLKGFLWGFQFGRQQGYASGAAGAIKWVESNICKDKIDATCTSFKKATEGKVEGAMLLLGGTTFFKEKTDYYVNELDAFYQTFPLCRGEDVLLIWNKLAWLWAGIAETSYNKIGAECGERGSK